jgi:hypothetical protein
MELQLLLANASYITDLTLTMRDEPCCPFRGNWSALQSLSLSCNAVDDMFADTSFPILRSFTLKITDAAMLTPAQLQPLATITTASLYGPFLIPARGLQLLSRLQSLHISVDLAGTML